MAFGSKSLTNVESRYANIERECLVLCYGLENLHVYIKPLLGYNTCHYVYKISLHNTILVRIGMVLADRLSIFPSKKENQPITLHLHVKHIQFYDHHLNII